MPDKKRETLKDIQKKYVSKKLLSVIDIELTDSNREILKSMTGNAYEEISSAHLMLFENNNCLIFVNNTSDEYRSGDWYVIDLEGILDKGNTRGIKKINSVVREIERVEVDNKTYLLIITDGYYIRMGQYHSDSYYPMNFFDIDEAKTVMFKGKYKVVDI